MTTPIRRQYLELKRKHPDAILLFRLGDFYEAFDDDARIVARVLGITLTSKPFGKGERSPLAGVPHQSIDRHITSLVRAGHRVAVCEQMADASEVKGIVPRDVVRVVTAGTITDDGAAPDSVPLLAAFVRRGNAAALALADVSAGELRLASEAEAEAELFRAMPAELLVELGEDVPDTLPAQYVTRPRMSALAAESELEGFLSAPAAAALLGGEAPRAAAAHILDYLRSVYPEAVGAFQRVRPVEHGSLMRIDVRTLRNLAVIPTDEQSLSLCGVLNETRTAMGTRQMREWLTHPLRELDVLTARLDAVEWMLAAVMARADLLAALGNIPDLARITGKVGRRAAGPRDLNQLRTGLTATAQLLDLLDDEDLPALLAGERDHLRAATGVLAVLQSHLADEPGNDFGSGDIFRAGVFPEIDTIRMLARDARSFLADLEQRERERSGIPSLKVGHNRVFGYYLEISNAHRDRVPDDYERRQTLVGAERYVTDELKEHESNLVNAQGRLAELERQKFEQLLGSVLAELPALQRLAEAVATIDVLTALGQIAAERQYCRPIFNDERRMELTGARHPVVEATLPAGSFVPNDCTLDAEHQIILLTGPNMSGKSTFLREAALLAIMAQAGSFVPATEAHLPLFDQVFSRIGAQDDLAAGQSTFMVEMQETAQILHRATPRSLVVLDEVGRGTSTYDGMAIAQAVVEFLHNRSESAALTLFATHYHELTALADVLPRVCCYRVAVSEYEDDIVFEYRVVPGAIDRSYGIHVARLAGLPSAVLHRAEHLLDSLERGSAPVAAPGGSGGGMQMTLFDALESPVDERLRALDIDNLTPIEAIQALYELRALQRGRS